MDDVIRTHVEKRRTLHFLVDGEQVWVSYLDENESGPFGLVIKWMENQYSCSPLEHITEDGGYSYHQVTNFMILSAEGGIEKRMGELETDAAKLDRLQRIWIVYQQRLKQTIFSV